MDSTENEIFGFDVVGAGGGGDSLLELIFNSDAEEVADVAQKRAAAVKKLALWAMGGGGRKMAECVIDSSSLSAKARRFRTRSLMICAETACIGKSAHDADGRLLEAAAKYF
jgi:predicted naringenin-chalcone synthase